ncbi:MAG: serine/threonine-protein kinase [Acidobacteriota bacterium]
MAHDASEPAARLPEDDRSPGLEDDEHESTIGPYRINERLGTGGMGEVLLAYDPRLDRQVAIKRVRPRVALDDEQRRRLRREARMAAKLGHSSIAQIHDLLVVGDIEHIIMEYVPGTTLRDLLELGPPPLPEALRIARRVADGLAHAHRHGVVHRDLKTENVLLHPEGEVKIVDFGLARPVAEDGDGLTNLTRPGSIVGTCRTMAPEQALGQSIDARTDLFSFGVLLYELFTGTSPFLARTQVATLQRIVQQRHRSVLELVPELPAELAELIDELLEKEPSARPHGGADEVVRRLGVIAETLRRDALDETDPMLRAVEATPAAVPRVEVSPTPWPWIVATTLLALLVVALVVRWLAPGDEDPAPPPRPSEPLLVAIGEVAVEGSDEVLDVSEAGVLRQAIRHGIERALVGLDDLAPIGGSAEEASPDADEVIRPSFACDGQLCWCDLRRLRRGRLVETTRFSFPADDPLRASHAAAVGVEALYPDRRLRPEAQLRVAPEDFRRFLEILHYAAVSSTGEYFELVTEAAAVRASSPEFIDIYLLEAELHSRLYHLTREQTHRRAAMTLLGQARDLAGESPEVLLKEILLLLNLGRVDDAEALLAKVERLAPGDSRLVDRRAGILAQSGRPREALALYRRLIDLRPTPQAFFNHARMALELGRVDEAQQSIDRMRELRPSSLQARTLQAELELRSGDLQQALVLYRDLATQDEVAAAGLALAQMLAGDAAEAAAGFEALTIRFPRHPELWLNLADARALSGVGDAEAAYRAALAAADRQDVGQSWRLDATRAQAQAHLGEAEPARASLEAMWRRAPRLAEVFYAASITSARIGDLEQAALYAADARATGLAAHWFTLPWFDSVDLDEPVTAGDPAADPQ